METQEQQEEVEVQEERVQAVQPSTVMAKYLADNIGKIENSLSGALSPEKFLQVSMNAIRGNEKLENSHPPSVLSSLLQAAEMQLFPGSTLGHAYLVPYWDMYLRANVCTYILGYKGMLALCHRSPKVLKVEAHTVHEGDEFNVSYGEGGGLRHVPSPWGEPTQENCLGAYAYARLANGESVFERMAKKDLEAIRRRAKSTSGPWKTDTLAMYRKTLVRQLAKWLPLEPEEQEAIAGEEAEDLGFAPRDVNVEPEEPAELQALNDALDAEIAAEEDQAVMDEAQPVEVIEAEDTPF